MLKWLTDNIGLITGLVGIITIIAIIFSPIIALNIQKKIENFKEENQRRINIFRILLATRANIVSHEHVQALNMIDIEFYKEKEIRESWNIYRDHLNSYPPNSDKSSQDRWEEKRGDYFTDLLYSISKFFRYDFDKVILKKGAYSPIAHGILGLEQTLIRRGLVDVIAGTRPVKVEIANLKSRVASDLETNN